MAHWEYEKDLRQIELMLSRIALCEDDFACIHNDLEGINYHFSSFVDESLKGIIHDLIMDLEVEYAVYLENISDLQTFKIRYTARVLEIKSIIKSMIFDESTYT
jgi:hypothetical protein